MWLAKHPEPPAPAEPLASAEPARVSMVSRRDALELLALTVPPTPAEPHKSLIEKICDFIDGE